jgi:hypothetical protein
VLLAQISFLSHKWSPQLEIKILAGKLVQAQNFEILRQF